MNSYLIQISCESIGNHSLSELNDQIKKLLSAHSDLHIGAILTIKTTTVKATTYKKDDKE